VLRNDRIDRCRVSDQMEIVRLEVDDPAAGWVRHEGVADIPLGRNHPGEGPGSRWDLVDLERREQALEVPQGLSNTISSQTPTDRKEIPRPRVQFAASVRHATHPRLRFEFASPHPAA